LTEVFIANGAANDRKSFTATRVNAFKLDAPYHTSNIIFKGNHGGTAGVGGPPVEEENLTDVYGHKKRKGEHQDSPLPELA
jgi:hypothetical protein